MAATTASIWYVDSAAPDTTESDSIAPSQVLRDNRVPDREAARALLETLFPDTVIVDRAFTTLASVPMASERIIYVGCYPGLTVISGPQLVIATPSSLAQEWIAPTGAEHTFFTGTDPARAWGAFALWRDGRLRRSFSSTNIHIIEDVGVPLLSERPFWSGERPLTLAPGWVPTPELLAFDPLDFAREVSLHLVGTDLNGTRDSPVDPHGVTLCGFELFEPDEEIPPPTLLNSVAVGDAVPPKRTPGLSAWQQRRRRR